MEGLQRMDAILHVGVTKTGTTTIQKFLRENREALGRQGFFVPTSVMERKYFGQHVGLAAMAGRTNNEKRARWVARSLIPPHADFRTEIEQLRQEFIAEVCAAEEGCRTALLSSEGIGSFELPGYLELNELLGGMFERVTVLVYLRRQDLHAASLFNSRVRTAYPITKMFPGPSFRYHRFDEMLAELAEAFGRQNIVVRLFERDKLKDGDSLSDFLEVCNIEPDQAFEIPARQNESLNAKQVAFIHLMQQARGERELPDMRYDAIFKELESDETFMPSRAEAQAYYRQFAEGNTRVAREYFGREAPLFDEDFSMYPESSAIEDHISLNDMARAMTRHLLVDAKLDDRARRMRRKKQRMQARPAKKEDVREKGRAVLRRVFGRSRFNRDGS